MKHKIKRALSAALACVMVLTLLPATALAQDVWAEVDQHETGSITFRIVNGTWKGLTFGAGSDGSINAESTEVTFTTYKYTKSNIGYVYVCGSAIENMLTAIISGDPTTYITPNDGYYAAGQSWVVTGGLTGSTLNANQQMSTIGAVTDDKGKQHSAVHDYDSTNPKNGFAKETTYTLTLQPIQYTVVYDVNGDTGTIKDTATYYHSNYASKTEGASSTITVTSQVPSKEGYVFDGWELVGSTDTVSTSINVDSYWKNTDVVGTVIDGTGVFTLRAKWVEQYTVTYDPNGGTLRVDGKDYTSDSKYTVTQKMGTNHTVISETPTRTGYKFDGWYDGSTQYGAGNTISSTTTLTAKWTPVEYTISYDLQNGVLDADVTNPEKYTIETATFTLNNPTKDGYTFAGWTGSNGTTPQTTVTIPQGSTGNKAYTANWTANPASVIWIVDGKTVKTETDVTGSSVAGSGYTAPAGYTFDGWYSDSTCTTKVTPVTTMLGKITYYGKTTANKDTPYTVKHYTEQADGTFVLKETEDLKGTTDTTATAKPKTYEGFVLDKSIVGTVESGTITGDGQLVLKLYYVTDTWNDQEDTDEEGDGIPDKYQVLIKYVSADENQGTVDPAKEVVTLYEKAHTSDELTPIDGVAGSTATPKSGYTFVNWIDNDGTEVATTAQYVPSIENAEGGKTYTFTANFTAIYYPPVVIPDPTIKVKGLNTVDHVTYIIGVGNDKVNPMGTITRAEIAAIYFRLMTDEFRSANWSTENRFKDVPDNAWYTMAILTLDKAGVITDSDDGNFRPNEPITRAELAVMAAQFCTVTGNIPRTSFKDVPADHWAAKEIALIEYAGWIEGYAGCFRPDDNLTRAEAVTIVNRMLQRGAEDENMLPDMVTFVDNTPDMWYYEAIQEAANCHDYTRTTKLLTGETFRGEKWTALLEATDWAALEKAWIEANS